MIHRYWLLHSLLFLSLIHTSAFAAEIIENEGQWPAHVIGAVFLSQSAVFIETGGHTIHLLESSDHGMHNYRGHVLKASIDNINPSLSFHWNNKKKPVYHYHQKSQSFSCSSYGELIIENILPMIDQHWSIAGNTIK